MDFKCYFVYAVEGRICEAFGNNPDFDIQIEQTNFSLKMTLLPKKPVEILDFFAQGPYSFSLGAKFFANGFQSWTDTREFSRQDVMSGLGTYGSSRAGRKTGVPYIGDYAIVDTIEKRGCFHSFSFAYVKSTMGIDFFGSLNDKTGYTIISVNMNEDMIRFSKDLEGVVISQPYEILHLYFARGQYDAIFNAYFKLLGVKPRTNQKLKGYTSWYNYYQNINEKIILHDLEALSAQGDCVNTYQIDDGYATMVGDWLTPSTAKFPNGLEPIVQEIHQKGLQAGIWIAPFVAEKNSALVSKHPEWLIKNAQGEPMMMGQNWGGFYALDIYQLEVQTYLREVFYTILYKWNFDFVKVDFLYAACAVPMYGKTRAEIAYDMMDFLRFCMGNKPMLACGAPLMPCFGKVEYMRIGPDMDLHWKHTAKREKMYREDVSTPHALENTIFRRCLNGRAFLNDSDVFILRNKNHKFTKEQQKLIAKFVKLFSNVLFVSDDISLYDDNQLAIFRDVMNDDTIELLQVNEINDMVFIEYTQNGEKAELKFNIADGTIFS